MCSPAQNYYNLSDFNDTLRFLDCFMSIPNNVERFLLAPELIISPGNIKTNLSRNTRKT